MNAHLHFKDPSSAEEHLEDIYNHPFLLNAFRNDIPCWQRYMPVQCLQLADMCCEGSLLCDQSILVGLRKLIG